MNRSKVSNKSSSSLLQDGAKLYVTAIACLAYGLAQYNEMVRCTVASAGNDHRLGAQEAPPAIISLYPGQGFEAFVESICEGGDLLGDVAERNISPTFPRNDRNIRLRQGM